MQMFYSVLYKLKWNRRCMSLAFTTARHFSSRERRDAKARISIISQALPQHPYVRSTQARSVAVRVRRNTLRGVVVHLQHCNQSHKMGSRIHLLRCRVPQSLVPNTDWWPSIHSRIGHFCYSRRQWLVWVTIILAGIIQFTFD